MSKKLIGALAVIIILAGGWYWVQTKTPATSPSLKTSSESGQGAPLTNVVVPAQLSPQAQQGETIFNATCASCHGTNAAGQDGVAPPLVHRIYEPSHHGDFAFVLAARNGVRAHHWPFGDMPPAQQALTDEELGAIVVYVRELQRANGIN